MFEIAAGSNTLTTLATFNGTNGEYPETTLIADAAGTLYGTTQDGGASGNGTAFELSNTGFVTSVPEPMSLNLIGISSLALFARRRRR